MSEALGFLLILPTIVLAVVVLDAAGTLGTAKYRSTTFAENVASLSAEVISRSEPSAGTAATRARWAEMSHMVEQSGLAATAGVCKQTDPRFRVGLLAQGQHPNTQQVAVVVSCPVELGRLFTSNHVLTASLATLK